MGHHVPDHGQAAPSPWMRRSTPPAAPKSAVRVDPSRHLNRLLRSPNKPPISALPARTRWDSHGPRIAALSTRERGLPGRLALHGQSRGGMSALRAMAIPPGAPDGASGVGASATPPPGRRPLLTRARAPASLVAGLGEGLAPARKGRSKTGWRFRHTWRRPGTQPFAGIRLAPLRSLFKASTDEDSLPLITDVVTRFCGQL